MSHSSDDLSRLENALHHARKGRRIVPVAEDPANNPAPPREERALAKKKALVTDTFREATTNEAKIRRWFKRWPNMNYGIVGGKRSGIVIWDADLDNEPDPVHGWNLSGAETFNLVLDDFGIHVDGALQTHTPSGGLHIFAAFPESFTDLDFKGHNSPHPNLGHGMDLMFAGGWVVGPGCSWNGKSYVMHDIDAPLATLSDEFFEQTKRGAPKQESRRAKKVQRREQARSPLASMSLDTTTGEAGINPLWMRHALFGPDGEVTKLYEVSAAEGGRDSGVFEQARRIAGLVLAQGSGITPEAAHSIYMTAAAHTIGGDWTYEDVQSKWARAMGVETGEPEATIRQIPLPSTRSGLAAESDDAPLASKIDEGLTAAAGTHIDEETKRGPGRPRKVNEAERGTYAWAWEDGVLDLAAVTEFLIEKHHIKLDDIGGLWSFEPLKLAYEPLTKDDGGGAPRRTIKAILGNKYSTTEVNRVISAIIEDKIFLEKIETERTAKNAHLVYLRNGLLNIETGEFAEYTASNAGAYQLPITYDPAATCPGWERQFELTLASDAREYVKEMLASVLLPSPSTAAIWMLGLRTNSGKSFLIHVIENYLYGSAFVTAISPHELNSRNSHLVRDLRGMLANVCPDLKNEKLIDVAEIKKLMSRGKDSTQAHGKYQKSVKFSWFGSMVFSMNDILEVSDKSGAWDSRTMYLTFPNDMRVHPEGDPDFERNNHRLLTDKEISGLFNEIVRAAQRIEKEGFSAPASAEAMRRDFETPAEARLMLKWLEEGEAATTLKIDRSIDRKNRSTDLKVERSVAWKSFRSWATEQGHEDDSYPGRNTFYGHLAKILGNPVHTDQGDWFMGLQITPTHKRRARSAAVENDISAKRKSREASQRDLGALATEMNADTESGEIGEERGRPRRRTS